MDDKSGPSQEVAEPVRVDETTRLDVGRGTGGSLATSPAAQPPAVRGAADALAQPPRRRAAAVQTRGLMSKRLLRWRGDSDFHPGLLDIEEVHPSPIRWFVRSWIVVLLIVGLLWASFGRLASYTAAVGRVEMAGSTNIVEALAPGKVIKIRARDGDVVEAGATLVELDPTEAMATRAIVDQNLVNLRAETSRLQAEAVAARAKTIDPNAKIPWGADVPAEVRTREEGVARADLMKLASQLATLESQKHAKEAERDGLAKDILAQKALLDVTSETVGMIEGLVKTGYNSLAKYLQAKAQLDDQQVKLAGYEGSLAESKQAILLLDSEMEKAREGFVTVATQSISSNEQAILEATQQLARADQLLSYMTLRAPTAGVVHASAVTTIGQVVKPGQQLMQIVPAKVALEVVAYLDNQDIGFIRKGDPATIKVDAFTYGTYGSVDGTVIDIANDSLAVQGKATQDLTALDGAIRASSKAQMLGQLQFPIVVRLARSTMRVGDKEIPLVPGMAVNVEIVTENRQALDYVLTPLLELLSSAGHEHS
jgi:hemolysin D